METTLTLWEETETRHGDAGCRQLVERYYVERRFVERCVKCDITSTRQVVERRYVDSSTHLTPPPSISLLLTSLPVDNNDYS